MINQLTKENANQNAIQVFYSENHKVFYLKTKQLHLPNNNFTHLITCKEILFSDFLSHLAKFTTAENPKSYTFKELQNKLNEFLIKRAKNCKVIGNNIEISMAS